jgi:hypothetical protein
MSKIRLMVLGLAVILLGSQSVSGHGLGKQTIKQQEAGPYVVSAWIDPESPEVDEEMHVTVSVEVETEPFTDAEVSLTAHYQDGDANDVSDRATHEGAVNQLFYEGELALPEVGAWSVEIGIDGEPGPAQISFDVDVLETTGNALLQLLGIIIVGVLVLGVVFQMLRSRRRQIKDTHA